MTSAAYKSAGTGRHAEGRGFGLVIFAAVLLDVRSPWQIAAAQA